MRIRIIGLLALVLAIALAGVPGPVAADDAPDSCADAETITATEGTIQGRLGPTDADTYVVEMAKGDFLAATIERSNADTQFLFDRQLAGEQTRGRFSETDPEPMSKIERESDFAEMAVSDAGEEDQVYLNEGLDRYILQPTGEPTAEIQIYKSGSGGPACIDIYTKEAKATAYNITYSLNDADPPELADPERVAELEARLETRTQRVSELKSQLEAAEERVESLNETVAELRAESGGSGSVTIDVTVSPGGDAEALIQGSIATVEATGAQPSTLSATYAGNSYQFGDDGQVAIPLAESGTQELQVSYGETTETVTLDVQAESDGKSSDGGDDPAAGGGTDGATTPDDARGTSGGVGPGFGVLATVLAAVLAGVVARYRP